MDTPIPRVLVIAEAANPNWVSVPLVGWNIATALRDVADVHIVTQVRNRVGFLEQGLVEGKDFTSIDSEAIASPFYKMANRLRGGAGKGWTTVAAIQSLSYPYFEHLVWKKFRSKLEGGAFDIVHRVTPLSPTTPSLLAKACRKIGIPFLLGPLNGGLPWHPEFSRERIKEREWLSYVRQAYAYLPPIQSTYRNASAIIVGSRHTQSELERYHAPKIYIPENGIDTHRFVSGTRPRSTTKVLQLIFVGRLVPYKGADVAIEACQHLLRDGRARLDIIGDGPDAPELQRLITTLALDNAVTLHGWRTHKEVAAHLRSADLLVFPSVREFGGGVVLEAMASGAVPIVIDYGGPGELVNSNSGFAIKIGPRAELVHEIEQLVQAIAAGEYDLQSMSAAGSDRVKKIYSWSAKAQQIRSVYDWVATREGALPNFEF